MSIMPAKTRSFHFDHLYNTIDKVNLPLYAMLVDFLLRFNDGSVSDDEFIEILSLFSTFELHPEHP